MAEKHFCACCGKKFYYCPVCPEGNTGYSLYCDTKECQAIVSTLAGYSVGNWGKSEVKRILDMYNITDYTKYKQSIQDQLNELFPVNAVNKTEDTMNPPIETKAETKEIQDTNEATNEQKENETEEVKPQRKRKSRKKKVVLSDETEQRDQSDNGDNL